MSTGVLGHMRDRHSITFVADDALAEGHDFMFVARPGGGHIFYRESAISPGVLEDSWAAYRRLLDERGDGPDDGAQEPIGGELRILSPLAASFLLLAGAGIQHADRFTALPYAG